MIKKFLFFLCCAVLCAQTCVFAQIKLDKSEIRLKASPGETLSVSILVQNGSSSVISVKGYFEDFKFTEPFDGRKLPQPLGSTPHSCGEWMNVSPSAFSLAPLKTQEVLCSVIIPNHAQGSYYGVLFFENVARPASNGVGIVVRMGCPFYIDIKGSQALTEIIGTSGERGILELAIKNSGSTLLIAKGSFAVLDEASVPIVRGGITPFFLPSEKSKVFKVNLSKVPADSKQYILTTILNVQGYADILKEIIFTKDDAGVIKIIEEK